MGKATIYKSTNYVQSHFSYSILVSCWQKNPNSRPSFELLHETLLNLYSRGDCNWLVKVELQKPVQASCRLEEEFVAASSLSVTPTTDSAISECHRTTSISPETLPSVADRHVFSSVNPGYQKESLPDSGCESEEPEVVVNLAKPSSGPCRRSGSSFVLSLEVTKSPSHPANSTPSFVNPLFRKSSDSSVDDAKILAEMAPDGSTEV